MFITGSYRAGARQASHSSGRLAWWVRLVEPTVHAGSQSGRRQITGESGESNYAAMRLASKNAAASSILMKRVSPLRRDILSRGYTHAHATRIFSAKGNCRARVGP